MADERDQQDETKHVIEPPGMRRVADSEAEEERQPGGDPPLKLGVDVAAGATGDAGMGVGQAGDPSVGYTAGAGVGDAGDAGSMGTGGTLSTAGEIKAEDVLTDKDREPDHGNRPGHAGFNSRPVPDSEQ